MAIVLISSDAKAAIRFRPPTWQELRGLSPDDCFSDAFRLAPHRERETPAADLVRLGGTPT